MRVKIFVLVVCMVGSIAQAGVYTCVNDYGYHMFHNEVWSNQPTWEFLDAGGVQFRCTLMRMRTPDTH